MAADTVDAAIKACRLTPASMDCQTDGLKLEGGDGFNPNLYIRLVQDYGLEVEVRTVRELRKGGGWSGII